MKNREKWYVIYTKSRHEKVLSEQLIKLGHECYLPLIKTPSIRKDRKITIEKPLFSSYVFVKDNINLDNLKTLNSFVRYLQFNHQIAIVYQYEIDTIKSIIKYGYDIEFSDILPQNFETESKIIVISGPLKGLEGIVFKQISTEWVFVLFEKFNGTIRVKLPAKILKLIE